MRSSGPNSQLIVVKMGPTELSRNVCMKLLLYAA